MVPRRRTGRPNWSGTTATPAGAAYVDASTPTARRARTPPPPNLYGTRAVTVRPPFTRIFAKFDFRFFRATPYEHWQKVPPPRPSPIRHLARNDANFAQNDPRADRRRRADARERWPMYMADVAYRIECLPQPQRRHRRTWEQVARDSFLVSARRGLPDRMPPARPRRTNAATDTGGPGSLGKSRSHSATETSTASVVRVGH